MKVTGVYYSHTFMGTGLNALGTSKMGGGKIVSVVSGLPLALHTVNFGRSIHGEKPFVNCDGKLLDLDDDALDFFSRELVGVETIAPGEITRTMREGMETKGPIKSRKDGEKGYSTPLYPTFMRDLEKI